VKTIMLGGITMIILATALLFVGKQENGGSMAANEGGPRLPAAVQQLYTDPVFFRSDIVQMVQHTNNMDAELEMHYQELVSDSGLWGQTFKERDAILSEALGPDYKNHPKIKELEVMVTYNLGVLSVIKQFDNFLAIRAGQLR
jgi:hypothetical protein